MDKSLFKNYYDFKGTLSRKKYWLFIVVSLLVALLSQILDNKLVTQPIFVFHQRYYLFHFLFVVTFFVPLVSATVRRLRDAGFSGWWGLLWLLPNIGKLALVVMLLWKSQRQVLSVTELSEADIQAILDAEPPESASAFNHEV